MSKSSQIEKQMYYHSHGRKYNLDSRFPAGLSPMLTWTVRSDITKK